MGFSRGFCQSLSLDDFSLDSSSVDCYDRETMPYTMVVDTHLHFRNFIVDLSPPFEDVIGYLESTGVLFANIYGIGQVLPADSDCTSLSTCRRDPLFTSFRNDILNAENLILWRKSNRYNQNVHLVLSMTFPDLSDPSSVLDGISFLDREYSQGFFSWMGEVNLVKQQFARRGFRSVPKDQIPKWEPFMAILRERNIPLALHSDLGNDNYPTRYISWMEDVLNLYPDNQIVWMHAGISFELTEMDVDQHIGVMSTFLDRFDNLMIDLSWSVLDEYYFTISQMHQDKYVDFINRYSTRILPGTDFVASIFTDVNSYKEKLDKTSRIYRHVSDKAFRNIALGENYFRLLDLPFQAPPICQRSN